jgi:quinol monooxygenase YgiN
MFAVIYRGYLKAGKETEYQKHWKTVATYFVKKRGALGSTLHRAEDGMWVAYSKWPDRATRDASWPKEGASASLELPNEIVQAINGLKACLDEQRKFPELCLEVAIDLFP